MSEVSERYARLADAFAEKVAAVPEDKWSNPSPCAEWSARDVVRHVVDSQAMFLGFVDRSAGDVPSVDDDPVAAWDTVRAAVLGNLEDPVRAQAEYEGYSGRSTFEQGVDRFLCFDLVVHGWDLARAVGLDERMDPQELDRIRKGAEAMGDAARSPQVFGPPLEPPASADEQAELLAFLGRQP